MDGPRPAANGFFNSSARAATRLCSLAMIRVRPGYSGQPINLLGKTLCVSSPIYFRR